MSSKRNEQSETLYTRSFDQTTEEEEESLDRIVHERDVHAEKHLRQEHA